METTMSNDNAELGSRRLTKKQQAENERNEAKEKLRGWLKPGDTVFTILRHVSRSGMMRHISLVANVEGETMDITYWAAKAMGDKLADDGGIKVGGCGMDMGFSLVYSLGRTLYPDGFQCCGKGCLSNDHSNDWGRLKTEYDDAHEKERQAAAEAGGPQDYWGRTAAWREYEAARNDWIEQEKKKPANSYSKRRKHTGGGGYALRHRWL